MKKIILLILGLIFMNSLTGCDRDRISGKYEFDGVIYLSLLSSSTKDYVEEKMEGTVYTINKDIFEIDSPENHYKISNPVYERKKMDDELVKAFDKAVFGALSVSKYKEKYQYYIFNDKNERIPYYIYSMDNELWIASYSRNVYSETIWNICKLK